MNARSLPLLLIFFASQSFRHPIFNIELKIGDKLCYNIALYRSPSQSQNEFEEFSEKFELNLHSLVQKNSFLVVPIRDFNGK